MKRFSSRRALRPFFYAACGLLGPFASTAHAHFLWANVDKSTVRLSFAEGADGITTDVPVDKIVPAHAWLADKQELALKTEGANRMAPLPAGAKVAGASQTWGVLDKSQEGRGIFLLEYGAKAAQDIDSAGASVNLPLELFAKRDAANPANAVITLLHNGKAVPATPLTLHEPGIEKPQTLTTDAAGRASFPLDKAGIYGIRAGVEETKAGEWEGKKYDLIRRYATLTFNFAPVQANAQVDPHLAQTAGINDGGNPKADAAAYALLKAAHESRQVMPDDFPGFTANIVFTDDEKTMNGTLIYRRKGKTEIKCDGLNETQQSWLEDKVMNLIGHRRGGSFAEGDGRNPLSFGKAPENSFGKLIELNDGLHSSYRVQDNKVTEVTRVMGGMRFTISVLQTMEADPGKYLANHFLVTYRDEKTGALKMFEGYRDSYAKFDNVWLPVSRVVVEIGDATTPTMRSIRLRDIHILTAAEAAVGTDKADNKP